MMRPIAKSTRRLLAASLVAATSGLAAPAAFAATIQYTNISAPSFVGKNSSLHNDGVAPDACAAQVALDVGQENRGDLQNAKGSFIANVVLPQGSTVTKFTLFANDADADINTTAYLMRKRIAGGLTPAKSNVGVMAVAATSGAVTDTMRAFSDTTIVTPQVVNTVNQYFVELVNCGTTVEPFSVQIVTSTP
jgi:hypothetical protein